MKIRQLTQDTTWKVYWQRCIGTSVQIGDRINVRKVTNHKEWNALKYHQECSNAQRNTKKSRVAEPREELHRIVSMDSPRAHVFNVLGCCTCTSFQRLVSIINKYTPRTSDICYSCKRSQIENENKACPTRHVQPALWCSIDGNDCEQRQLRVEFHTHRNFTWMTFNLDVVLQMTEQNAWNKTQAMSYPGANSSAKVNLHFSVNYDNSKCIAWIKMATSCGTILEETF